MTTTAAEKAENNKPTGLSVFSSIASVISFLRSIPAELWCVDERVNSDDYDATKNGELAPEKVRHCALGHLDCAIQAGFRNDWATCDHLLERLGIDLRGRVYFASANNGQTNCGYDHQLQTRAARNADPQSIKARAIAFLSGTFFWHGVERDGNLTWAQCLRDKLTIGPAMACQLCDTPTQAPAGIHLRSERPESTRYVCDACLIKLTVARQTRETIEADPMES